jgi:hypothetical protein
MLRAEGRRDEALEHYERGLQVSERITRDFGETPQSLRDLAVSRHCLALIACEAGESDKALAELSQGHSILTTIRDRGWADANTAEEIVRFERQIALIEEGGCPFSD